MARSDPQINFRIPQELKDALDVASAENRRSLTAEVVARLQASFENNSTSGNLITMTMDDLDALVNAAIKRGRENPPPA